MITRWAKHFSFPIDVVNGSESLMISIYFSNKFSEELKEDIIYYIQSWYESAEEDKYGLGTVKWMSDIESDESSHKLNFHVDLSDAFDEILAVLFYILDQAINIKPVVVGKLPGTYVKIDKIVLD
jgi:hypothetical protein